MELRSVKIKDYKTSLISLGLYEEGMKLKEMKQMMQALEESQQECETFFFQNDLEQALKESELDCVHAHSSTMITQIHDNNLNSTKPLPYCPQTPAHYFPNSDTSSPFNSPAIESEKLVVEAIVHHDINWSPHTSNIDKRKVIEDGGGACDIKRLRPPITSSSELFNADSVTSPEWLSEDRDQTADEYCSDPSF